MPVIIPLNRPGVIESVWESMIGRVHTSFDSGRGHSIICLNCYLIDNKNLTVTKFWTYIVNILWELPVKYYTVVVFIVEYNH
jgi:hypothetical protein